MSQNQAVAAGTRIGHVHLKVADLDRALGFYCGVLGFELMQRMGSGAAFISAGGYHHHIGLNTWESKGGSPPPPDATGLYHTAILYPTRPALADALHRVLSAGIALDGASDHGVSEALYLRDPDQNGVELYWDKPPGAMAIRAGRQAFDVHEAAGCGGAAEAAGGLVRTSPLHEPQDPSGHIEPDAEHGMRE
ncbi:catechol 2,3-dioxygenase [Bradyrhizobium sp. GM22.5]